MRTSTARETKLAGRWRGCLPATGGWIWLTAAALPVMLMVTPAAAQHPDDDGTARPRKPARLRGGLKVPKLPSVVKPSVKRAIGGVPGPATGGGSAAQPSPYPKRKPAKGPSPSPPIKKSPVKAAPAGPAKAKPSKSTRFGVAPGDASALDKAEGRADPEDEEEIDRDVYGNPDLKPGCGLPKGRKIAFNLREAELYEVVQLMAAYTCRRFIIPHNLKRGKKITIIANDAITVDEAWRAFLSAMEVNGMTVVPAGRFLKIAQSTDAKSAPVPLYMDGQRIPSEERLVTRLISLKHVDSQEIQNVLVKLKSKVGEIIPYPRTNTLIVTDYGHVLRRFLELLKVLDVPGGSDRVWVYQVQYATASELSAILLQIFEQERAGSKKKAGGKVSKKAKKAAAKRGDSSDLQLAVTKIIPDERTNQLIVIADEKAFSRLIEIIKRLDVSIPGEGQVHVYYLKNANAEDIGGVLSGLTSGTTKRKGSSSTRRKSGGDSGATAELFEGEVKITADQATNSLVVVATLKDYLSLVNVVKKLDIRRPQVYVEAIVMEVNLSKSREVGVATHGVVPPVDIGGQEVPFLLGTNMKGGQLNSLLVNPTGLMGFAALARGPSVDASGVLPGVSQVPSFGAVLNALQTNDDVNILSTPHILTTDNEEAEIKVGQNVPFIAGGGGRGGGLGGLGALAGLAGGSSGAASALQGLGGLGGLGGSPFFNVQRQDVALTLTITPQINESDFVRLKIEQTIEELGADNPGLGPTTTKRSARTVIVAKDQQTVVIGGLMRDNVIEGVEKVPFLGDIPVIGYLFRTEKKTVQKQNLLLLLTPYIIRDPSDFRAIFVRKMREYKEFMEIYGKRATLPDVPVDYRKKHGPLQAAKVLIEFSLAAKAQIERFETEAAQQDPLYQEIRMGAPTEDGEGEAEQGVQIEIGPGDADPADGGDVVVPIGGDAEDAP